MSMFIIENTPNFEYGGTPVEFVCEGEVCGIGALIFKLKDKGFSHMIPKEFNIRLYSNEWPMAIIVKMIEMIKRDAYKNKKPIYTIYRISDNLFFNKDYDFNGKAVGFFQDAKNRTIYDLKEDNCLSEFERIKSTQFIIENDFLEKNFKKERSDDYILNMEEAEEAIDDAEEWPIIKMVLEEFSHSLVFTAAGTLRFQKEELTDKEKQMNEDINQIYIDYADGKLKYSEIMKFFLKEGVSVQFFYDKFLSDFREELCEEDIENEVDPSFLPEEEILKIIRDERKPTSY